MTPYSFAQEMAEDLKALKLELGPVLPQLGDIVVDCAGIWVSVTNTSEQDLVDGAPHCGAADMADVQIVGAFECSITSDDEGLTDPELLADVSARLDVVGERLREYTDLRMENTYPDSTFSGIQFQNTGGLGMVVVSFTTPIP